MAACASLVCIPPPVLKNINMKIINKLLVLAGIIAPVYGFCQQAGDTQQGGITQDNVASAPSCASGCCCGQGTQTPLGVMTDHVHPKGEWMVSYTYMDMNLKGSRAGASNISDETVYKAYDMSPETMQMQMSMFMVMYGATNKVTLMLMGGFTSNYMTMNMNQAMQMMPGMNMSQMSMTQGAVNSTYGLSDTKIYGLYSIKQTMSDRLVGALGINLPTGSTTQTGLNMFTGANGRLAYMMQLGTGSYGALPSLTYVHTIGKFGVGAEGGADVNLNKNADGYTCGNIYNATVWGSYRIFPFMSASLRAEGINQGRITGADKNILNPSMTGGMEFDPTADPKNSGGTWVNTYAGLNFHLDKPIIKMFTFQCEYGLPVYQNLNGTQMAISSNILAGIACKF